MKRRLAALMVCLALVLARFAATKAEALAVTPATPADFDVPCQAAVLMDENSGTILYEKAADEQRPIASITKVMTLLLTFEALESGRVSLEQIVPISEHAYHMGGSQIWLEPGEQFTLNEMLKAVCISSANDAAVAVAEFIGGSEDAFVEQMNTRAAQLGMQNTHFCNACGLDEDTHYSSARDVAIMSREMLLKHDEVKNYCTVWMDSLRGGQTQLVNTNKMLNSYNGMTGLKTGTTNKAGVCITASATREGLNLIAVVLGSSSGKERFAAAGALLDYGFANYESRTVATPETAVQSLPVTHGTQGTVELCYAMPESCLLRKGGGAQLHAETELPQSVEAPVQAGQKIGTLRVLDGATELQSCEITAAHDVAALSFGFCFRRLANALLLNR